VVAGAGRSHADAGDAGFIDLLNVGGVAYGTVSQALSDAHVICRQLMVGVRPGDIAVGLAAARSYTLADASWFTSAAHSTYCPGTTA
jgi:hypothetical protein